MNRFWRRLLILAIVFFSVGFLFRFMGQLVHHDEPPKIAKNSIFHINLDGIILNGRKFTRTLDKYKEDSDIKAIVVEINSPGGAVGPSQEIYDSILKIRTELKKPIICVSSGLLASGAYYSAVACDRIVVAPGAMVGSIGVIMEFANLEKLYDWAKVNRFTITSGKYKDSGAEYRSMRDDERHLFQSMINEVYLQFRNAVRDGRKLSEEILDQYADGRVFTGQKAVEFGFADKVGYLSDGFKLAAEMANLGKNYEIFRVPKKKFSIWDLARGGGEDDEEDMESNLGPFQGLKIEPDIEKLFKNLGLDSLLQVFRAQDLNRPMLILPGYWNRR